MRTTAATLLAVPLLLAASCAVADDIRPQLAIPDSAHVQLIRLGDGTTAMGRITAVNDDTVRFRTGFGEMAIAVDAIDEVRTVPAAEIRGGRRWVPNPNATRLFFGPTARLLERGRGYFADYCVLFPTVTYGVFDHVTIGGGMSLVPGLGLDRQIYYLTPKAGFSPRRDLHLAAGALVIGLPVGDDSGSGRRSVSAGIVYAVATCGTLDRSLTAGLGYGYADGRMADKPMVMLGGEHRLSRRTAFVSENWLFPGLDQPAVSAGIRFFGEGMCCDLALVNVIGEDMVAPGIPYVDFVINF